jgi:hypothetical protein
MRTGTSSLWRAALGKHRQEAGASGRPARCAARLVAIGLVAAALSSFGSTASALSPTALLAKAKATVNAAHSVHFQLHGSGPSGPLNITAGQGDLVRPNALRGSLQVVRSGLLVTVKVVAKGTKLYLKLPFHNQYTPVKPAQLGIGNPDQLISRTHGLASVLPAAQGVKAAGTTRLHGELLRRVSFHVPGKDIPVLPNAAPRQPVQVMVAIDPSSYELRQVTMTGPFVSAGKASTYVVTLTHYGEHVSVHLPPGA